jgi:hypothetical protein
VNAGRQQGEDGSPEWLTPGLAPTSPRRGAQWQHANEGRLCLEAYDLAASKLAALREKDRELVRVLLAARLVKRARLVERLRAIDRHRPLRHDFEALPALATSAR